MAKKDEEEKRGFVGGLVNDLAMGLGLRDRDQRYYDRTAATIGNNQGQAAYDRYRQQTGMAGGAQVGSANMPLRGGLLSAFGVTGPRDFFDGGGLGRSGDTFQGSPYSILLNALGVKPYGYAERQGRADQAIADLQNPAKWMAGYGGGNTRNSTKSVAPEFSMAQDLGSAPQSGALTSNVPSRVIMDELDVPVQVGLSAFDQAVSAPAVDTSTMKVPTYDEFAPWVLGLYKKEAGSNATLSDEQLRDAYRQYKYSLGVRPNSGRL